MGHGEQPLSQLCIQQLRGNPHFASHSEEATEQWVDATLIHNAEWGEEGPVQRDVSLRYRLEVLVQPVEYWVDEGVPKAESSRGEGTEDASVDIGVVTGVLLHHLHAGLTKDLGDEKRNATVFLLIVIFMIATTAVLLVDF